MEVAAQKYELMRNRLISFFEYQGCPIADDLTDDTFNRVARKINEGTEIQPTTLAAYFIGVARHVFQEYLQGIKKRETPIDLDDFAMHPAENPDALQQFSLERLERERMLDCLDSCIQKLAENDRKLIVTYYQGEAGLKIESRKYLANRFQLTLSNLRTRVFRIRERLERCVEECYEEAVAG